tara:strand:+ start:18457 stop:19050 length:594 start_codon:yes stop_codon:yes gene_type:complete
MGYMTEEEFKKQWDTTFEVWLDQDKNYKQNQHIDKDEVREAFIRAENADFQNDNWDLVEDDLENLAFEINDELLEYLNNEWIGMLECYAHWLKREHYSKRNLELEKRYFGDDYQEIKNNKICFSINENNFTVLKEETDEKLILIYKITIENSNSKEDFIADDIFTNGDMLLITLDNETKTYNKVCSEVLNLVSEFSR